MRKKPLLALMAVLIITLSLGCPDTGTTPAVITPEDTVIDIAAITGVTAPVLEATPVTTITETDKYTGTVIWNGAPATFAASTVYAATITLTAKAGYTLTGVGVNYFTVAGAATTNPANSGVITAVFPATGDGSYKSANIGTLKYVSAGTFYVGTTDMTVSSFRMSQYEVTGEQYAAVMGVSDPSYFASVSNNPVETVNWYSALVFCNKLSMAESLTPVYTISGSTDPATWGAIPTSSNVTWNAVTADWSANGYRLPTEMEWMWAAMGAPADGQGGGTNTTGYLKGYAGSSEGAGQTNIGNYVWYGHNSGGTTHSVGGKTANELGLYDMSGNVWEWCWDWDAGYPVTVQTDYHGAGSGAFRVSRGGDWYFGAPDCTVACRGSTYPYIQNSRFGFRVVRN